MDPLFTPIVAGLLCALFGGEGARKKEVETARREGVKQGVRKGNIKTAKKFEKRFKEYLEKDEANKIAAWALGICVANLDGIVKPELDVIYQKVGDPNSNIVNPALRDKFKKIYENPPTFSEVKKKYLDKVEDGFLKELNEYVNKITKSNKKISDPQKKFLEKNWKPYLLKRNIIK